MNTGKTYIYSYIQHNKRNIRNALHVSIKNTMNLDQLNVNNLCNSTYEFKRCKHCPANDKNLIILLFIIGHFIMSKFAFDSAMRAKLNTVIISLFPTNFSTFHVHCMFITIHITVSYLSIV